MICSLSLWLHSSYPTNSHNGCSAVPYAMNYELSYSL